MPEQKIINLALQGGGAHGAFTWGVLDRLLDEKSLTIEGISGASAGAINGALFSYGLASGGPEKARELLATFWKEVSLAAVFSPLQSTLIDRMLGNRDFAFSPAFYAMEAVTRVFSPEQFNFFDVNPLRDILDKLIAFNVLRKKSPVKLFVNVTGVLNGKPKIFTNRNMSLEALLASACLPFIFKTVEIDGEPYWDGGYCGNPALFPLVYECGCRDCVIVQVNPIHISQTPKSAPDILDRVNEISFNASLMHEIRAISFVQKLIEKGVLKDPEYKYMHIHMIEAEEIMEGLGRASKFNADWEFLEHLKQTGRQAASDWLERHYDKIGVKSTIDIRKTFLS